MTSPTITSISPTMGPVNQWVYINGTNFIPENTQFYFNNVICVSIRIYNNGHAGFFLPDNINDGYIKVVTPNGEFTSDIKFTVGTPLQQPTVISLRKHPNPDAQWMYVDGTEFVYGKTQVTYNSAAGSTTLDLFVYNPNSGGFKNFSPDPIKTIVLTTPNGSCNFTVSN